MNQTPDLTPTSASQTHYCASELASNPAAQAAVGALRDALTRSERVVVKIGSRLLSGGQATGVDQAYINRFSDQIRGLMQAGKEVILVTSGAIAAGTRLLNLDKPPADLHPRQAVSTIGQVELLNAYRRSFDHHNICIGQVLLTRESITNRKSYLNARNALNTLLAMKALPVINENDAVAVEEIRQGDNDQLSANVALLTGADALVILTDQPGLLTADPRSTPDAERIACVLEIDDNIRQLAGPSSSGVGLGGMATKLLAADMITRSGELCAIVPGREERVLDQLFAGRDIGTIFRPHPRKLPPRKRWLAFGLLSKGILTVDDGAANALKNGKSLLAAGICGIRTAGEPFSTGDLVQIVDPEGREIGRGLSEYDTATLERIQGKKSEEIKQLLDSGLDCEVIHRDNMVVT